MKKSTLITTIAMIVVVVVALSTATYAWFSSAASTYVTTTVSTTAATGVTISAYDYSIVTTDTPSAGTLTSTANVSTTSSTWTIESGVWSPTAAITATVDKTASLATMASGGLTNLPLWYTGTKEGTVFTIDPAGAAYNKVTGKVLRIANNTDSDKKVQVFIVIDLGADPSNTDLYAATALRFYLNNSTDTAMTTGYKHAATSVVTTTGFSGENAAGLTQVGTADYSDDNLVIGDFTSVASNGATAIGGTTSGYNQYTTGALYTGLELTATTNAMIWYTAAFDLAQGKAFNYATFAWFDGWLADDTIRGTTLQVHFYVAELTASGS